jgi:UDP-glucose 4-epimerase
MFAFENAEPGDIFFRNPAATIETLAIALKEFNANEIKIIGERHGEKLYETSKGRDG